jgi:hypothetical protein
VADGIFNIAKGKIKYYAELGAANDALVLVLLKSTGLEADDTLNNYDDLAALLAASNDECDATNYARKIVSADTVTIDDTNNRVDMDFADQTWAALGGATNNTIGKLLVCYDPDTTGGTDSSIVPLAYYDFTITTDGSDVTVQLNAAGFARAS